MDNVVLFVLGKAESRKLNNIFIFNVLNVSLEPSEEDKVSFCLRCVNRCVFC